MGRFAILIVIVIAVVGLWSGGWLYAAGQIHTSIDSLAGNDGETAPRVTCGTRNVSGFPFRFDIECADAVVVAADATMTLAGLRVSVLAYNPTQARISALSPLTLADAFTGARSRIDFSRAEGSARLTTDDAIRGLGGEGWRPGRISLVADDIAWVDTLVGETPLMNAGHLEAHLLDIEEQHDPGNGTASVAALASLTDVASPRLGITGGELGVEAELTGLPDDVRALSTGDLVARWQQAGGQLKLVRARGAAGEEFVEASGTLALDSGGRVDGQLQLSHRGLVERMGNLIPEEWKPVVLGGRADDGSYAQTLSIRAGVIFAGLIPLSVIPPLI